MLSHLVVSPSELGELRNDPSQLGHSASLIHVPDRTPRDIELRMPEWRLWSDYDNDNDNELDLRNLFVSCF